MLLRQVVITPPFPYLLAGFAFLVIVLGNDKKRPQASDDGLAPAAAPADEPLQASASPDVAADLAAVGASADASHTGSVPQTRPSR